MTKLYEAFNRVFLYFLRLCLNCFNDEVGIQQEFHTARQKFLKNKETTELFEKFNKEVLTDGKNDYIYEKKVEGRIPLLTISPMFKRMNMAALHKGFDKEEQEVFWDNLESLACYASMLKACGSQMPNMENMAATYMKEHPNMSQEECRQGLLAEMLSGGAMSKQLLSIFQDPQSLQNIMSNVTDIMRSSKDKGDPLNLMGMMKGVTDEELKEISQQDMGGFRKMLKAGGMQIPSKIVEEESDEEYEEKKE